MRVSALLFILLVIFALVPYASRFSPADVIALLLWKMTHLSSA